MDARRQGFHDELCQFYPEFFIVISLFGILYLSDVVDEPVERIEKMRVVCGEVTCLMREFVELY